MLSAYFSAHPQNSEAASLCLKCLVDMIVAGKTKDKEKSELIAECEKYANCVFKYETDADAIFMSHFVLARGAPRKKVHCVLYLEKITYP